MSAVIIRGFNRVQFTWWGKLPEQWANLAPLIRFMVSGEGLRVGE